MADSKSNGAEAGALLEVTLEGDRPIDGKTAERLERIAAGRAIALRRGMTLAVLGSSLGKLASLRAEAPLKFDELRRMVRAYGGHVAALHEFVQVAENRLAAAEKRSEESAEEQVKVIRN